MKGEDFSLPHYREGIKIKFVRENKDIKIPVYAHPTDSGCDVCAKENWEIAPGKVSKVPTGLYFEIPEGYEIQVRSRSGLSLKDITVHNAPGTIDSPWRGQCEIILKNDTSETFYIKSGDRIAQLVLQQVPKIVWEEVDSLSDSDRGTNGFGSTGIGSIGI
jgi:dUTP pyrophosphatase